MIEPVYTSLFGVYAVIESACGEQILLVRKKQGPYEGLLDLPGGPPEAHEILEQTLVRQTLATAGHDINTCIQLKSVSSLFEYSSNNVPHVMRHIGVMYKVKKSIGTERASAAVWMKKSDIVGRDTTPFVSLYLGK